MAPDPLGPFVRAPARAGLFLDFDGVLADIASDPDSAVVRAGVADLLVALSRRLGRVAIISGRPVAYVAAMIPDEIDVVGIYGLEWRFSGVIHTLREAEQYRARLRDLADEAAAVFGSSAVEAKGLSLTLHYRSDPDLAAPMQAWASEHAEQTGLDLRLAKQSYELHPPIRQDKGTVLVDLSTGLDPVAFFGDDLGDLPAFDALDQLSARGTSTLRVAVDSAEAPPVLRRRADLIVDGPAGAEAALRRILHAAESAPR